MSAPTKLPILLLLVGALSGCTTMTPITAAPSVETAGMDQNEASIRAAFTAWREGTGGPFALLAPDASWTITGNSFVARTYHSRDEFMTAVIKPFNARLARPLVPTVQSLHRHGDTVIVRFRAEALALDGKPYANTYAWFMDMKDGRIVKVTAFFDSIAFDEFWERVLPPDN